MLPALSVHIESLYGKGNDELWLMAILHHSVYTLTKLAEWGKNKPGTKNSEYMMQCGPEEQAQHMGRFERYMRSN